jgi:hypothetical protein
MEAKQCVNISSELYAEIEALLKNKPGSFDSVDKFVEFLLSEYVKDEPKSSSSSRDLSKADEQSISERLKALGYE